MLNAYFFLEIIFFSNIFDKNSLGSTFCIYTTRKDLAMKRASILIFYFFILLKGYSQQIAFKPSDEFSYQKNKIQISGPSIFMEDVNNDGILDYYAYLSKGYVGDSDTTFFDTSVVEGYYCVIRNADGSIRARKMLKGDFLGPTALVDFNNDGKKELLYINRDTMSIIYRIDSLSHTEKVIASAKNFFRTNSVVADINNDGLLDIVNNLVSFKNQFYIYYQVQADSFRLDTLSNPILKNIYNSQQAAQLKIGDFNSDGKKDFLIYSDNNYNRLEFYMQQDSGKFAKSSRSLVSGLNAVAVLDYNHDGRDDILVELELNKDSIAMLAIPQTTNGITSFQNFYRLADNINSGYSGDKRLTVCDLNCDGYPEVIRFGQDCDVRLYIYETKFDTTFSKLTPLNLSQKIGIQNYEGSGNSFFDFNGDNRLDLLGAFSLPKGSQKKKFTIFKNISINDQTNLSVISIRKDTLDEIIPGTCNELYSLRFFDTLKIDSFYKWETEYGTIINPATGHYGDPAWVKKKYYTKLCTYGAYLPKVVYEDTLFATSGFVCGKLIQDTFRRRVLKDKYIWKKYVDTSEYTTHFVIVDVAFKEPAKNDFINEGSIKFFPIPAKDKLYIDINALESYKLEFYDCLGNFINIPRISENEYDVSKIKSGVYIVVIQFAEERLVNKIIIEHD